MRKSLFIGLFAILGLIGCSRNQEIDVPDANLSLFARTESPSDTKTVVESGVHVYWEPGDEIAVFMGEKAAKFTTDITAASGTATFKGTFGDTTWPEELDLWAVYPFSEDATFYGETITTILPSEQVARESSFGKDMNLSIAHSNSSTLQFYNVGGGIRFSVTEEGIKKVIFEGLSGEIISGKVKIGMDENGKPEVKEVTGGSQFITLLPPSGSETFEKDTWYYIVAIPGSLESGYKLRFYKDSDYARRVSEKAVQIKRSIFGNIEQADEGIEYEAQTLHFPKTDEEIKESSELMSVVNEDVNSVIKESTDISTIAEDLKKVDGVIDVIVDESNNTIAVQQKDSVWINYFLDSERIYAPMSFASPTSQSSAGDNHGFHSPRKFSSTNSDHETIDNAHINKKRNAIILAPYVFDYDLNGLKSALMAGGLGISEDNIIIKQEHQVLLSDFLGSNLSRYDVIMIISHGGIGCGAYHQPEKPLATIIDTGIPYSEQTAEVLSDSGRITLDKVAFIGGENLTFAMTSDFIGDANFNNASVFLMACHSAEHLDDEGSLVKVFLDSKAGIVTGNNRTVHSTVTSRINSKITYLMSKGFSLQNAFTQIEESDYISAFCDNWYEQVVWYETNVSHPQEYSVKDDFDVLNTYVIEENPSLSSKEYYLIDPFPSDLNNTLDNGYVDLTWSCPLEPFSDSWRYPDAERIGVSTGGFYYVSPSPTDTYTIVYDIYVDGRPIHQIIDTQDQIHEKRVRWEYVSSDKLTYKWFVVAHILKNNLIVASYRSIEDEITLKPDPPQVETFPASVDVGYVFLSGDVTNRSLEGLETGFYYYKLTAQEESTELSASEKERLVMGGKKILSSGDYKDYFGVDLTDIEQDSKYLFVAYAKDEYNQTGHGEVLSFTTGSSSVHVNSVSLNKTSLELGVGNTETLVATVLPENASNKKVIWSSSDNSKVTVSSVGVVKGIALGNAVITATTEDGGKTATCKVSVTQSTVHVESVSLNKTDLELTVGNSATLVASVLPENAANKSVTWSSSNSSKATVSSTGVVTGVAEGSAVITATTVDGGKTASCFVTVHQTAQPDPEPRLSVSTGRLDFGNQVKFTQESQDITITNSGTGTLQITSISKTNNYGDLFQLSGWTSGGAIAAGASKTITVSFQPLEEKYYEETLTIVSSNSVGDKKATITICGTGISESGNALIQVSCDELEWGDVEVGNRVTKSFSVMNTGTTDLNISSIKIVATDNTVNPSYFTISPNTSCSVSSGNTLTFNVTFIPESECGYYAMVSIKSNASNATQGTSTVWLSGVGIKASSSYSVATPEIVDLGLSIKWASFNLGATKPEEYGDYFYWGETEPMDDRDASSYKFLNGAQALTKYNTDPYYTYLGLGIIDNKTKLDQEDDAAYVNLGGNWRMPTDAEWTELRENCSWTWTTENGVEGYKVISKKPGYTDKWIFLPAPGERSGTDQYNVGFYGYYWSSSLYTDDPLYAYSIFFSRVYVGRSNKPRYAGISIRPVYSNK